MVENSTLIPTLHPGNILAVKITAGITCILSVFGASLIILTYMAFKDLRTTARQLLVNLCIADIIVALSHFVGLFVNFERFSPYYNAVNESDPRYDALCIAQGVCSIYGTLSSLLWSVVIAVYLLLLIVSGRLLVVKLVPVFYILSWGIPLVVVIAVAVKQYIGFEPIADPGWCYTTTVDRCPVNDTLKDGIRSVAGDLLSYEAWVTVCLVVLPVIYLFVFCYLRCKKYSNKKLQYFRMDIKLLLVPIIFLLLRVWIVISVSMLHYSSCNTARNFKMSTVAAPVLTVLSGIGLNAQGFANAILFCVFTKQIRQRLLASFVKMYHICVLCKWKQMFVRLSASSGRDLSASNAGTSVNSTMSYGTLVNMSA